MAFKTKKFKVEPVGGPTAEMNVTPLVDVVLVLLIIFMVVTPLLEKDIDVRVPQTEEVETTADVPPDQLVVNLAANGEITVNNQPVAPNEFLGHMKDIMSKKRRPEDKLAFFTAHDDANYGQLVGLLDQAKVAGVETIGMMTELPPEAQGVPGAPPGPPPAPPAPPAP